MALNPTMQISPGTVFSPPSTKKALARVALVDLKESARTVLSECFRQFGIETVIMADQAADRLKREKFEACVVRLSPETEPVLDSARSSPSNNRMVIYGMGGTVQDAMKYSKYGINAVFNEPIERPSALKLVRATQMLVLHEFRRYVRIPVITEVSVVAPDGRRFTASSQEISTGGMSLRSGEDVSPGQAVEISFALLTLPRIWVRSTVSWRMPGNKTFGVRFDALDERRLRVKEWIDSYLDN
jgi:hypothetical protein